MRRFFKSLSFFALIAILGWGFFVFDNKQVEAVGYNQGDVVINEFYIAAPDGVIEWYEFMNTTDFDIDMASWTLDSNYFDLSVNDLANSATTTIPAKGILVGLVTMSTTSDQGDILQLKDPSDNVIYAVSYGTFNPPLMPHVAAPGENETAILVGTSTWQTTTSPSKGWFNNAIPYTCEQEAGEIPPTLSSIDVCLVNQDITSNLGELTNPARAEGLYFSKADKGKLYFNNILNLTDQTVVSNISLLGEKMELGQGKLSFDSEMAAAMGETGASLEMYSFDTYGYDGMPEIYVYDDSGTKMEEGDPGYPIDTSTINYTDGTLTFDVDHFTEFDTGPSVNEITPVSTPTNTSTPTYVFGTNVIGTYQILGSCAVGGPTSTTNGSNSIILGPLSDGIYNDCSLKVIDGVGNSTTIDMSDFTVVLPSAPVAPTINQVNGSASTTQYSNDNNLEVYVGGYGTTTPDYIELYASSTLLLTFVPTTTPPSVVTTSLSSEGVWNIYAVSYKDGLSSEDSNIYTYHYDVTAPKIISVSTTKADGYYPVNSIVPIRVNFDETVEVVGTPHLYLNVGDNRYTSWLAFGMNYFSYTVVAGDNTEDLDYTTTTAIDLNGGTIKDLAGNDADLALPAVGTFSSAYDIKIDTAAPTGSITNINDGDTLHGTVNITATATDSGSGVQKVEFYHASADVLIGEDTEAPYSIDWNTTSTSNGSHTIWVKMYDNVGNYVDSAGVSVTVDNSIQYMIDNASEGDTITVPAGTYEENITIDKRITLIGDIGDDSVGAGPNAPVIIDSAGNNRTVNILSSGVVFRGFIVENDGSSYPALRLSTNVGSTTIKNNTLRNAYSGLTLPSGTHDNTITKNKIYSNTEGIFLNSSVKNTISYNDIYSNSDHGIEFVGSNNAGGNNINSNHIYSNTWHGIHLGSYLDTSDGTITIDSNNIELNGRAGVRIEDNTSGVAITGNTIDSNGQNEITTGIHTYTASGNYARGNTITSDNSDTGVVNGDTGNIFDASMNWWGYESGPYHSTNPSGEGDNVSDDVSFSPWYGEETMVTLHGVPTESGDEKSYTITEDYSITTNTYTLEIPANTTVTGTLSWDGTITPPTTTSTPSNLPSQSGYTTTAGVTIEVGFASGKLILSNAAKLTFPGQKDKRVGYTRAGESFTEITTICGAVNNSDWLADQQNWANDNLGTEGDCKVNSGNDLVVWTKHFTKFSTFTLSQNSTGGGGTPIVVPVLGTTPIAVSGGNTVKTRDITLLFNVNYATMVAVSEKSNFSDTSWGGYSASQAFKLSEGYGSKVLYVKFRSATGGEISTQLTVNYVTPETVVPTTVSGSQATVSTDQGFTFTFRTGLTENQKQSIMNLVNSGRIFSQTDARNYAWAIGVSDWQQFVGKNPKITVTAGEVVSRYVFTKYLGIGSVGNDVKALQQILKELGYFTFPYVTSYYGSMTKEAVVKYQKAKGLAPYPGHVGPATRAALNAE